jgi:hypothetical protein
MLAELPFNSTLQTAMFGSMCNTQRTTRRHESFNFSPALTYLAISGIVFSSFEIAALLGDLCSNTTLNFLQIDNKLLPGVCVQLSLLTSLVAQNRSLGEIRLNGIIFEAAVADKSYFLNALNANHVIEDIILTILPKPNRAFKKAVKHITRRSRDNKQLKYRTLATASFKRFRAAIEARFDKVRYHTLSTSSK